MLESRCLRWCGQASFFKLHNYDNQYVRMILISKTFCKIFMYCIQDEEISDDVA